MLKQNKLYRISLQMQPLNTLQQSSFGISLAGIKSLDGAQYTPSGVLAYIYLFETGKYTNIIYKSAPLQIEASDPGCHSIDLPPTTLQRDVEPWVEFVLLKGHEMMHSRLAEIESVSDDPSELKIGKICIIQFRVKLSKLPFSQQYKFVQVPRFALPLPQLPFAKYAVEVHGDCVTRQELVPGQNNQTLELSAAVSVNYSEQVVIKIQGTPFLGDFPVQYYTLFQYVLKKGEINDYIPQVIKLKVPSSPVHQQFLQIFEALPALKKITTSFGSEKLQASHALQDAVATNVASALLEQKGYLDYFINPENKYKNGLALEQYEGYAYILKMVGLKSINLKSQELSAELNPTFQVQFISTIDFSKADTLYSQMQAAIKRCNVSSLLLPYETSEQGSMITITTNTADLELFQPMPFTFQKSLYSVQFQSTTLRSFVFNTAAWEPRTIYQALQIPFIGVFSAALDAKYKYALLNSEIGLQDCQDISALQLQKQFLLEERIITRFSIKNQTQTITFVVLKSDVSTLQDRINLIGRFHERQLEQIKSTVTTQKVQMRDVGTQDQNVQIGDTHEVEQEITKIDVGDDVLYLKDELKLRFELVNSGKLDQAFFGAEFFQCKNQDEFMNLYTRAPFFVKSSPDKDAVLLKCFNYLQNNQIFPAEYFSLSSHEVQVKQIVKLDLLQRKDDEPEEPTWYKISADGNLISPTGQRLGLLEQMTVNGQPALGSLKLNPIIALKMQISGDNIYDVNGKPLCKISQLCDQNGDLVQKERISSKQMSFAQKQIKVDVKPESSLKIGLNGALKYQGEQVGKLQDMTFNGQSVLGDLKITPLTALKYRIEKNQLFSPEDKCLGKITQFKAAGKDVFTPEQRAVLAKEE